MYQRLIETAQRIQTQAKRVGEALSQLPSKPAARLARQFQEYGPRLAQGLQQAYRRVILGEAVPAKEKLVSLFEPQTQIIRRHKIGKRDEFGRKLRLDEVEGGIIAATRSWNRGGLDQPDSLAKRRICLPPAGVFVAGQ